MQLTDWVAIMSLVVGGGFFLWPSTHSTKNLSPVSVCDSQPLGDNLVNSHMTQPLGQRSGQPVAWDDQMERCPPNQ